MPNNTRALPKRAFWGVAAGALGISLGCGLGFAFQSPVIALLAIGIAVAIIQVLVLRRYFPTIRWWLWVSIVGLAWGIVTGIALTGIGFKGFIVSIAVLGASYGMIQWLFLFSKVNRQLIVGLSLPIVALAGWFLYNQASIWVTPMPRFVYSDRVEMAGCAGAAKLFEAEVVEDEQMAQITRVQAGNIANNVVYRHFAAIELPDTDYFRLVYATFQDGQRRLAWYKVVTVETYGLESKASIVYIDAQTGEPLALATNVWLTYDPCMSILSCGCPLTISHLSFTQYFILGLLISYMCLLLLIIVSRGGIEFAR